MRVEVAFSDRSVLEIQRARAAWLIGTYEVVSELLTVAMVFALPVAAVRNIALQTRSPSPEWSSAIGLFIIALIPVSLVIWRFLRRRRRREERMTASFPQTLTLNPAGIETRERDGRILFASWRSYSGFKEGKTVFLLRLAGKFTYRAIPFDQLPLQTQGEMRAILLSHLREFRGVPLDANQDEVAIGTGRDRARKPWNLPHKQHFRYNRKSRFKIPPTARQP